MLSFEKCKELFDAGLRRERPRLGDLYYFDEGVVCIITANDYCIELIRCDSLNERAGFYIYEIVRDVNFVAAFTLEEIVSALHTRFGIDYIRFDTLTVEHAADVYLKCMGTTVPEKPLEIKLGGIYRMRNGGAAMVYAVFSSGKFPVSSIRLEGGRCFSSCNNGFYVNGENNHPFDFIRFIGTVDQIEWEAGMPMWRRKSDGAWVRSVVNETYLELIKEDPYSYAPVYENGRFVRSDVGEAELMRQAFMESMKKW